LLELHRCFAARRRLKIIRLPIGSWLEFSRVMVR
jgi:hypothetical protein